MSSGFASRRKGHFYHGLLGEVIEQEVADGITLDIEMSRMDAFLPVRPTVRTATEPPSV